MRYKIIAEDGTVVNSIIASSISFVESYCAKRGYTYERIEEAEEPSVPTEMEKIRADIDYLAAMGGVTL